MRDPELGKHALYSATEKRPLTCTVECSRCREETRVGYVEFVALLFPVHFHLPPFLRYHHSWLKCPSCGHRTWVRIHLNR